MVGRCRSLQIIAVQPTNSTSLQRSRVQVGVRRGEDVQEGAASRRRRQRRPPLATGDLTAAAVGGTQEAKENAKWYWRQKG
jgi:hypothetical protein